MGARSVTGAILIGGDSRRMGQDKAAMPLDDANLTERIHDIISPLVSESLIVTRSDRLDHARALAPSGVRIITDRIAARGPLVGIHAALSESSCERVLVVACDMPQLQPALLAALLDDESADVIVPRTAQGFEPLHAVYSRSCLPAIERKLALGPSRIPAFFDEVSVSIWEEERLRQYDPRLSSFVNWNSPADLSQSNRPESTPG